MEQLEDRTLPAAALWLQVPEATSAEAIPVTVSTTLGSVGPFAVDVDLNHDGQFHGAGELAYAQGDFGQGGTLRLHGLAVGTYQVRARLSEVVSGVETLQVVPPPAFKLPVNFEPNVGQADDAVLFLGRAQDQTVYITASDTVIVSAVDAQVQRFRLVGGAEALPTGQTQLPGVSNYLVGNDASKWRSDVLNYRAVVRHGVYAGIDQVYHSSQNHLEYDFRVAPGVDPSIITLEFPDATGLSIDANGSLLIHGAGADVRKSAPVMYQEVNGQTIAVKGDWQLRGTNQAGYVIAAYDASRELVIDPVLFSTLLGGSAGGDSIYSGVSDSGGNFYVAGNTTSTNFPLQGEFQSTIVGQDCFVTKINAAGTAIVYSTFLGGSGTDGGPPFYGLGIGVNSLGEVAITSATNSADFPLVNAANSSLVFFNDAFVAKLNAAGNGLVFSTFMGSGGFDSGYAAAFDATGAVYATGNASGGNFPVTAGALQTTFGGGGLGGDAWVAKFSPTGNVVYCTYIGGSADDVGQGIAVVGANVYVGGITASNDFPITAGAFQTTSGGGQDMFVAQLNATGTSAIYSTYVGGSGTDGKGTFPFGAGLGFAVDTAGNAFLGSASDSPNYPVTAGVFQSTLAGASDVVITKLNPTGTALVYSTYIGGTGGDIAYALTIDAAGNAYVVGDTGSSNYPVLNNFQNFISIFTNVLITEINPTGTALVFSTFLGSIFITGRGVGLDGSGNVWVAGTGTASIPLVNSIFAGDDIFVAKVAPTFAGATFVESGGSTAVTEGGATDTLAVVLNSAPSANVILTYSPGAQLNLNLLNMTFTPVNWNVAQTLIVTAVNDFSVEGVHSGVITTTASSADLIYNGVAIAAVTVSITDNDVAGLTFVESAGTTDVTEGAATDTYTVTLSSQPTANVTVTLAPNAQVSVAPAILTFTTLNWNVAQTVTVTAVDDAIAEVGQTGVIAHTASSTDPNYSGALATLTVAITDNESAGVALVESGGTTTLAESGGTDVCTLTLDSQPLASVTIILNSGTQITVSPGVLTFTALNWNVPQTVTMTAINDTIAEGLHTGVLTLTTASADLAYNGLAIPAVTASITDNDVAGATITVTAGSTDVAEGGTSDTYRVVLDTQPLANVSITLTAAGNLTLSPSVLLFTAANWNLARTVTVAAIEDVIYQGPHTVVITHAATSTDPMYNGIAIADVTANVTDNDPLPGLTITEPFGGITTLEGLNSSYTVALLTQPAADVVLNLTPDAQVSVVATVLTFTTTNWNVPQLVGITTVEDNVPEGNHVGLITHTAASADAAYNAVIPVAATVHIVDNDGTIIAGTDLADSIIVNFTATKIQVNLNGKSSDLAMPVTQLVIFGWNGNDFIQVNNPSIPVVAMGKNGSDQVYVVGSLGSNNFTLDSSAVIVNGVSVSIWETENLIVSGKSRNDAFVIQNQPAFVTELKGDTGVDTVRSANANNAWRVTGSNVGTLGGNIKINGIENWVGGTGNDSFVFNDLTGVTGQIDGGGGTNALNFSAFTRAVTVNLLTGVATGTKSFANIQSFSGGQGTDKLIGPNTSNVWTVTATGGGDVGGIAFQGIESLTGGKLDDTFLLADGMGVKGQIDGGLGRDLLDYSNYAGAIKIDLQNKTATNLGSFLNLESYSGGAGLNDLLIGPNRPNKWTLAGGGGDIGGPLGILFANFESYTGGTGTDQFTLQALGDWLGTLDGAAGLDTIVTFPGNTNTWTTTGPGRGTFNGHPFLNVETRK